MTSNDPSGKATNYGEVALLKVDLSGLQSSAEAVSVNGAATALTAEGAKAFAGFYDAGKDMAPAELSAAVNSAKTTTKTVTETVYEGEGCDPVTGKPLASTVHPVLRAPWLQASSLLQLVRVPSCTLAAARRHNGTSRGRPTIGSPVTQL